MPPLFDETTGLATGFCVAFFTTVLLTLFVRTPSWPFKLVCPPRRPSRIPQLRRGIGTLLIVAALYPCAVVALNIAARIHSGSDHSGFLSAYTDTSLLSGVSLLFVGMLVTVALLAMTVGWWRRTFLLDVHFEQFTEPPPIVPAICAFPLPHGFRSLNSKLMLLVGTVCCGMVYLLIAHVCGTQVVRPTAMFAVVWYGLLVAILAWWLALLNLCGSYAVLKTLLYGYRQRIRNT